MTETRTWGVMNHHGGLTLVPDEDAAVAWARESLSDDSGCEDVVYRVAGPDADEDAVWFHRDGSPAQEFQGFVHGASREG